MNRQEPCPNCNTSRVHCNAWEFIAILERSFNATLNPNCPESTARSQCWLFHLKQNAQLLWNCSEKNWVVWKSRKNVFEDWECLLKWWQRTKQDSGWSCGQPWQPIAESLGPASVTHFSIDTRKKVFNLAFRSCILHQNGTALEGLDCSSKGITFCWKRQMSQGWRKGDNGTKILYNSKLETLEQLQELRFRGRW